MADMVLQLKVDLSDLDKALKEIESKLKGAQKGGKSDIKVGADTKEFDKSLRKTHMEARRAIRGVAGFFFEVGFAINGAKQVLQLFVSTFNTLVGPSAKLEQLRLRLENLYQDTEKANNAFKIFVQTAKTTPFSVSSIVEAGASLKAFGVNAEENIKIVADLAAYMGTEVPEAASSMGRAFAGGVGAADVFRERGILALVSSFTGIEDLSKLTLPEFRKAMLDTFRDPASGVAGATSKMVNSYVGAVSNMKDAWELFRAELGQELTPVLANVARGVGGVINSLSKTNFEKVRDDTDSSIARFSVLTQTLRDMGDVTNGTDVEKGIFKRTIQALNTEFKDYVGTIDTAITKYDSLTNNVEKARRALVADSAQRIKEAKVEDWTNEVAENIYLIDKNRETISQLQNKMNEGITKYNDIARKTALEEVEKTGISYEKALENAYENLNKSMLGVDFRGSMAGFKGQITGLEQNIVDLGEANTELNQKITEEEKKFVRLFIDTEEEGKKNKEALLNAMKDIDDEYAMTQEQALIKAMEDAKKDFESISEEETQIKLAKYEKFKEAEKEYNKFVDQENKKAQTKAREDAKKLQNIEEKFMADSVEGRLDRKLKSLEIERDRYLQEAKELGASEETLKNIELAYQNDVRDAIEENLKNISRQERVAYQEKLTRLKNEKELGMSVYKELIDMLDANIEQAKGMYGEDSQEYIQAQADKKKATKDWADDFVKKAKDAFDDAYPEYMFEGDWALVKREEAYLEHLQRIAEMEEEGSENRIEIEKKVTEQKKSYNDAMQAYSEKAMSATVGQGQALMSVFQGQSKKMFNISKGLALANASINAYAAIQRAFADYSWPFDIIVAGIQGALAWGEYKKIEATSFTPKAEKGGLTGLLAGPSHAGGGIMINAEGDEYITKKQRVRELGVPFFDFINNAPLEEVKKRLSPSIPMNMTAMPNRSGSYASGGPVSSGLSIDTLISEVKLLRQELREKKMTVINKISANEVLEYGDDEIFSEKSEKGDMIRSVTR